MNLGAHCSRVNPEKKVVSSTPRGEGRSEHLGSSLYAGPLVQKYHGHSLAPVLKGDEESSREGPALTTAALMKAPEMGILGCRALLLKYASTQNSAMGKVRSLTSGKFFSP